MSSYLLDSNILMDFFKKRKEAIEVIAELVKKGEISISILSITELRAGWTEEQAVFFLSRLYKLVKIKRLTEKIAELAGKFRHEYKLKGVVLPAIDTLIAATAIIYECQLVTRNKKDFPMRELRFYPIK